MVTHYVPEAGNIVMQDFDPQVGREQASGTPPLHTDQRYNRASGLAVVLPPHQHAQALSVRLADSSGSARRSVACGSAQEPRLVGPQRPVPFQSRTCAAQPRSPTSRSPARRALTLRGSDAHTLAKPGIAND